MSNSQLQYQFWKPLTKPNPSKALKINSGHQNTVKITCKNEGRIYLIALVEQEQITSAIPMFWFVMRTYRLFSINFLNVAPHKFPHYLSSNIICCALQVRMWHRCNLLGIWRRHFREKMCILSVERRGATWTWPGSDQDLSLTMK